MTILPTWNPEQWTGEGQDEILAIVGLLGVPPDIYADDPLHLVPALQNYVSRLPFDEFEQSDWRASHGDLLAYLADYLIRRHGARRRVVDDPMTPRGFRYVIEVEDRDRETRRVDPADVVFKELGNRSIDIVRLLASAELTLGLPSSLAEEG